MTAPVSLPASCEVEALRVWINALAECDLPESSCRSCLATARAVRALVEAKVREALRRQERAFITALPPCPDSDFDAIVSRVLGAS